MANDSQSPISADDLRRLSDIFMPRAKARMDEVYGISGDSGSAESARFVHYTSAEAAFTIIKEKTLWMRNTNVMSDASEVRHGYSLLNQYFKDPAKMTALTRALSKSSPGAAELAIRQFDEKFNDIWYNTYITSISEHADSEDVHGRLSMWRAFGGSSARVAIVFRIPRRPTHPDSVSVLLSPVEYLDETGARALLDEAIESIRAGEEFVRTLPQQAVVLTLFMMLLSNSVCFKHEGFHEEREWRAIYAPGCWPASSMLEPKDVVYGGIPQSIYQIRLNREILTDNVELDFATIFDRLIIGPTPYGFPLYQAFANALKTIGISHPEKKVTVSQIPIRH